MTIQELKALLQAEPFHRFSLRLPDGRLLIVHAPDGAYDDTHGNMIFRTTNSRLLYLSPDVFARTERIS